MKHKFNNSNNIRSISIPQSFTGVVAGIYTLDMERNMKFKTDNRVFYVYCINRVSFLTKGKIPLKPLLLYFEKNIFNPLSVFLVQPFLKGWV